MRSLKFILMVLVVLIFSGCSNQQEAYEANMFYMDTYINVKVYTNDSNKANEALKEADNIYKKYHELSDRYDKYDNLKNIYYVNHELKVGKEISIDSELYDLINYSYNFCKDSDGLLNIALGNVIDVWKQYRDGKKEGFPTMKELQNSGSIKLNDLVLKSNNIISKKSNITLDLGAFAKGYATEKVGKYLESVGLNQYIINAGGNVKVGNHYNDGKYKIGIEKPTSEGGIYKTVAGNNISVTTSGSYERFYEYNGKIYSHIIDSRSLLPSNYMLSVTVISKDSALSDALDTMLFLMPIQEGIDYVNDSKDIEAIWYGVDNKIYYSKDFSKYE